MSADRHLFIVADERALAQSLAGLVGDAAQTAIAARGRFNLVLAGGSTPKAAYALLAAPPVRDALDWTKVHFFFGDERCVPPDDDQSNYKMARETLLAPLGIAESHAFRMRGEDEPQAAALDYAALLRRELGAEPVFDLVMLGMGPDGHTASLFPGTDPLLDDDLLVKAPFVAKFESYRITLTPRAINAAREVAIATAGPEKTAALTAVLEGPRDPVKFPIQIVRPAGRLVWLVDRVAAAGLQTAK
jgi:6-phosphogluconolactonase